MASIKIVTDSSCLMEPGVAEELNIHVATLSVMIDGVMYTAANPLSGEEFMEKMATAKTLPKTSQPPIGEFVEMYDQLGADGSTIISIHMTEAISGTVQAAHQAAQLSTSDVTVIDSTFTDQGQTFQVVRAAELAQAGADKETILSEIEKVRDTTKLYIGVAKLDNLVKGGRISRATGVVSNLLNMRVVMELVNSELVAQSKGRGAKAFAKWFDQLKVEMQKLPKVKKIGISHAGDLDLANRFKEGLQELFPEVHIPVMQTTPIVATHTGAGAFAIMFYTEEA